MAQTVDRTESYAARGGVPTEGLAGLMLLAAPLVLLVTQLAAQARWRGAEAYSWARNNVSDLGNVECGLWDGRSVCSPAHLVANVGFVLTGLCLLVGFALLRARWVGAGRWGAWASLLVASLGWVLAGVFPADRNLGLHLLGALLIFVVAPVAVWRSGGVRPGPGRTGRVVSGAAASVGLLAFAALVAGVDAGVGPGGMERLVIAPALAWAAWLGVGLVRLRAR